MANIVPTKAFASSVVTLTGGQSLRGLIINPDGTVAQVLFDDICPLGQSFTGQLNYNLSVATQDSLKK